MDRLKIVLELLKISGVHGGMIQSEIDDRINKVCKSYSELMKRLNF